MSAVQIRNIAVSFSGRATLSVPSASFEEGAMYGIVGPSGAGKSTLLRVLNLLERPQQGLLSLLGRTIDLANLSHAAGMPLQRQMAFVAQKPVMFQTTVFDNVALGLAYRGISKRRRAELVHRALELVGLQPLSGRRASSLSGGEAQRIALARALVVQPKLLLLDEPSSNLDPTNVSLIENVLRRVRDERSMTVIIVTHQLQQARRLCDQCLLLNEGRIVEWSDTEPFFEAPRSPILQHFLSGKMIY